MHWMHANSSFTTGLPSSSFFALDSMYATAMRIAWMVATRKLPSAALPM